MKKNKIFSISVLIVVVCCCATSNAFSQDTTNSKTIKEPVIFSCCRPDGHSPIGVMTDHIHAKGEWSLAYCYMDMFMKGNLIGDNKVSTDQVYLNYMMAPNKMKMHNYMLMGMYGVTNRLTLISVVNYLSNTMTMNMMSGSAMMSMPGMSMVMDTTNNSGFCQSSGFGDTKLFALYNASKRCNRHITFGMGINIPTGSVSVKGTTVLGTGNILDYPMQLGSGTWDLLPSIAFSGISKSFSWGISASGDVKPSTNKEYYALGNSACLTSWLAYKFSKYASCSARMEGNYSSKITGYDPRIAILMYNDPAANAANFGGSHASILFGFNLFQPTGDFKGTRFQFEFGIPVYQNLNGPQMSTSGLFMIEVQKTFNMK